MNYTPEDYVEYYNDKVRKKNAKHGFAWVGLLLLVVCTSIVLLGCDFQAAQATQESIEKADEQKAVMMGMPCTYVAQCGLPVSDCPLSARKCVKAGLK